MSRLRKRSFRLAGHATSVALEPEFWQALEVIASSRGKTLLHMVGEIDAQRTRNLASEIRVFILAQMQSGQKL